MNEFKVLGIRHLDFVADDGKAVKGYQLWVLGETVDPAWLTGYETVKLWFPEGHALAPVCCSLKTGDMINVRFNRRGKPDAIELA